MPRQEESNDYQTPLGTPCLPLVLEEDTLFRDAGIVQLTKIFPEDPHFVDETDKLTRGGPASYRDPKPRAPKSLTIKLKIGNFQN